MTGVATEEDLDSASLGQCEEFGHLAAGDHARFIDNQYVTGELLLFAGILEQALNRQGTREADLFQFLDGGTCGSDRNHLTAAFGQTTLDLLERGGLAGAGRSSKVDRQVAGIEYDLDGMFLFGPQAVRDHKLLAAP